MTQTSATLKKKLKKQARREAKAMQELEQARHALQRAEQKLARFAQIVQDKQAYLQACEVQLVTVRSARRSLQADWRAPLQAEVREAAGQRSAEEMIENAINEAMEEAQAEETLREVMEEVQAEEILREVMEEVRTEEALREVMEEVRAEEVLSEIVREMAAQEDMLEGRPLPGTNAASALEELTVVEHRASEEENGAPSLASGQEVAEFAEVGGEADPLEIPVEKVAETAPMEIPVKMSPAEAPAETLAEVTLLETPAETAKPSARPSPAKRPRGSTSTTPRATTRRRSASGSTRATNPESSEDKDGQ